MRVTRRHFVAGLGGATFALGAGLARGQDRPMRVLVGYAAGGAADTVARIVGDGLREASLPVIVENRAGASGRLATEALIAAPADGSQLLMTPLGNLTLYPHVFQSLRYEPLTQFAAVAPACSMSFALAVGADSPARSLDDYLARARQDEKLAAYGTPGAGTAMHFIGQLLARQAGLALTHVAYRGGSAAVTDAIGGTLPAVITTLPNLLPAHRSGRLRILAISDAEPLAVLPGVPTFSSLGFKDLAITETFAFFARSGTAAATIARWQEGISRAVATPRVAALLVEQEYQPRRGGAEALDRQLRDEYARWGRIVAATGYTPES